MFIYNNNGLKRTYFGFTYRHTDALALMLGIELKVYTRPPTSGLLSSYPDILKIMYSYDINTGPLAPYGFNAHEISLIYIISK